MVDQVIALLAGTAADALAWSGRLVGLATLVVGLQTLVGHRELAPGGALDVRLVRLLARQQSDQWVFRVLRSKDISPTGVAVVVALAQCIAGAALVTRPSLWPLYVVLLLASLAVAPVLRPGLDGADDMLRVLTAALALGGIAAGSYVGLTATALFVGGVVALAYFVAGLSKAQSVLWWSGRGLQGIVTTEYFGIRRVSQGPGWVFAFASWAVLLWESFFPLALLAPAPAAALVATRALGFHLICGIVMGLDGFVLAFAAGLPCVVLTAATVSEAVPAHVRLAIGGAFSAAVVAWLAYWLGRETRPTT
ncbi:hypothetical protein [Microbispora rosea]